MGIGVLGVGYYAPEVEVGNAQISEWTGATSEWIDERTGVHTRRYAAATQATSDLAVNAAREALRDADCAPARVGVLAVATSTPDQPLPGTAAHVQREVGLPGSAAFDINAVCSGFVYGCVTAASILLAGGSSGPRQAGRDRALVVGADMYSRIMNRGDRRTVTLFGDGAGAAVLGPVPDGYGILGYSLTCDGRLAGLVDVPAGGTRLPLSDEVYQRNEHLFRMDGRAVKEYAMAVVPKMVDECAANAGIATGEIDRVILHQGNVRMVETLARHLGFPTGRVEISADRYGNTAAASVPMTLAMSHQRSPLQRGDVVLLACVGGGMTAGAVLIRWF